MMTDSHDTARCADLNLRGRRPGETRVARVGLSIPSRRVSRALYRHCRIAHKLSRRWSNGHHWGRCRCWFGTRTRCLCLEFDWFGCGLKRRSGLWSSRRRFGIDATASSSTTAAGVGRTRTSNDVARAGAACRVALKHESREEQAEAFERLLVDLRRRVRSVLRARPFSAVTSVRIALEHRRAQCRQLVMLLAEPHDTAVGQVTATQTGATERSPLALALRLIAHQNVHSKSQIPAHRPNYCKVTYNINSYITVQLK